MPFGLSLLHGRDIFINHGRWRVGDGETIRTWEDKWGPEGIEWSDYHDESVIHLSDLMIPELRQWSFSKLRVIFPSWIAKKILAIPISKTGLRDEFIWRFSKRGDVIVKSCYNRLMEVGENESNSGASASFQPTPKAWKLIWKLQVAPKIRHFMWKLLNDCMASKDNLVRHHIGTDRDCPICKREVESLNHMFMGYSWTKAVWFGSRLSIRPPDHLSTHFLIWIQDWLFHLWNNDDDGKSKAGLFCYLLWHIWKSRNKFVHESGDLNPLITIKMAEDAAIEFIFNHDQQLLLNLPLKARPPDDIRQSMRWQPPLVGCIKANCDGAFKKQSMEGAVGIIFRDWSGKPVGGRAFRILGEDALTIKGQAVLHTLLTAKSMGFHRLQIETDCKTLLDGLMGFGINSCWKMEAIFKDIKSLQREFDSCNFTFISRCCNKVADRIAKKALFASSYLFLSEPATKFGVDIEAPDIRTTVVRRHKLQSSEWFIFVSYESYWVLTHALFLRFATIPLPDLQFLLTIPPFSTDFFLIYPFLLLGFSTGT